MSSRQQEKERRRQERLAREAEAAKAERQRRVIGFAAGGVLVLAAIVAIIVAVASGGGSSDKPKPKVNQNTTPIPAQKTTDLKEAAGAAGCTLRSFTPGPNDRQHVNGTVHYKQNPPVFGPHNPVPAHDGDYVGQGAPPTEQLVHAMEHGRVIIWYQPSLPQRRVSQLETLFTEPIEGKQQGYKQLLVERSNMPYQVAATAWGQQLVCPQFKDATFDAIRAFRAKYVEKGPENIPFPE